MYLTLTVVCKRSIIIQGSKTLSAIQFFFLHVPTVCLGLFLLGSSNGLSYFFSLPHVLALHKLSEEFAKGRLAIQETGMEFGVGMGKLRGSP